MKQALVIASLALTINANAQTNTTGTPLKRPVFFGITASETVFTGDATIGNVSTNNYQAINNGYSIGTMLVIPVLRKWEAEGAFEFCRWRGKAETHSSYVMPYTTTGWEEWSSHKLIRDDWRIRAAVSYEVYNKGKFSAHAGVGGRMEVLNKFNWIPGEFMAEAGMKVSASAIPWLPVQLGLWYGRSHYADYVTVRAALLLRGDRN